MALNCEDCRPGKPASERSCAYLHTYPPTGILTRGSAIRSVVPQGSRRCVVCIQAEARSSITGESSGVRPVDGVQINHSGVLSQLARYSERRNSWRDSCLVLSQLKVGTAAAEIFQPEWLRGRSVRASPRPAQCPYDQVLDLPSGSHSASACGGARGKPVTY